ncbi:MAG: hypothetical protein OXI94_10765 [Gemmatimonadota bacterium]|nr:hypothetical protein [Gemmatimonadota bacterium]MDE2955268.1 hypothetical protein [Gemmatimonadota bacterium]
MKILVISSCSKRQKHPNLSEKLGPQDFNPPDRLAGRMIELRQYKASAAKMYKGDEHLYVMNGLGKVRDCYGRTAIDLSIISTGYGLINECTVIVPYDVPLNKSRVLLKENDMLHKSVEDLIADYELIFFFLGQQYYNALELHKRPFQVPDTVIQIFLIGKSYKNLMPDSRNAHFVPATELVSELDDADSSNFKGLLFKKLCEAACWEGLQVFEEVKQNPKKMIRDIALGNRLSKIRISKQSSFHLLCTM